MANDNDYLPFRLHLVAHGHEGGAQVGDRLDTPLQAGHVPGRLLDLRGALIQLVFKRGKRRLRLL